MHVIHMTSAHITRHRGWQRDEMAEMRDFVVMILISKHKNSSSNDLIECNVMLAWARRGREHVGGNPGADDADAQNHIIIIANLEVSHGARSQKERLGSVSAQLRCMLCAYIAGRIVDRAELDGGSRHVHTRQRKSKEGFLATFFSFISRSDDELPDHSNRAHTGLHSSRCAGQPWVGVSIVCEVRHMLRTYIPGPGTLDHSRIP